MLHFSTQRFSYGELPQNTISKKCKITNTTLLFSYYAKAKPLVLNVSWDLQIRRRVGTGSKCSVLPWMSWCINGSVFHLHKCNEVLLGLRVWTDGFTGAPGSSKSLWWHYRTPIMFSFASVNCTSGRASLANPHRCSRGLCIHITWGSLPGPRRRAIWPHTGSHQLSANTAQIPVKCCVFIAEYDRRLGIATNSLLGRRFKRTAPTGETFRFKM